jgi:transposase-like protein
MTKHKSEDYKLSAVKYFLENKDTQENTCKIFKCSVRSLLRWTKRYMKKKMKLKDIIENQYRIKLKRNILSLYWKNLKTIRLLQ